MGCIKVRDITRYVSGNDQWDIDRFNSFKGVLWEPAPGSKACATNVRIEAPRFREDIRERLTGEVIQCVTRRFRINRSDYDEVGLTPLCPGCRATIRGLPSQGHSELCRSRTEDHLMTNGDTRIKHHTIRIDQMEERETEEQSFSESKTQAKTKAEGSTKRRSDTTPAS